MRGSIDRPTKGQGSKGHVKGDRSAEGAAFKKCVAKVMKKYKPIFDELAKY